MSTSVRAPCSETLVERSLSLCETLVELIATELKGILLPSGRSVQRSEVKVLHERSLRQLVGAPVGLGINKD